MFVKVVVGFVKIFLTSDEFLKHKNDEMMMDIWNIFERLFL